jgi:hypothetical protein
MTVARPEIETPQRWTRDRAVLREPLERFAAKLLPAGGDEARPPPEAR